MNNAPDRGYLGIRGWLTGHYAKVKLPATLNIRVFHCPPFKQWGKSRPPF
jgi:hypothetical protein